MQSLTGKCVLLTGASGGIGQALAQALATKGANVVLIGRHNDSLCAVRQMLPHPERHGVCVADLATATGRASVHEYILQHALPVDILINNAGINTFALLADTDEAEIAAQLHTNLQVPILLTRSLLPLLLQRPAAMVVNIGSTFGAIGFPGYTAYCASKFGLRGFSEALRRELADTVVKVLHIAPRATQTAMNSDAVTEMNRELGNAMDDPAQVAAFVLSCIHKQRSQAFLGFPECVFARVNALLPAVVDKAIFKQLPVIRRYVRRSRQS